MATSGFPQNLACKYWYLLVLIGTPLF